MSLDGSVCFFIFYHYESNSILATPIVGLDNKSIFKAYKTRFRELEAKGFKPKLNIMDNQATKHIKQFLTENECKLQLVKPHNHRVNAAERAIQTFKGIYRSPGHNRQRLPITVVGQDHPTSAGHAQLDARVQSGSHKIGV